MGRTTEHRMSMLRNLATSLINAEKEHIVTTVPKAKELRPFVEKAITLARKAQALDRRRRESRRKFIFAARLHAFSTPATARSRKRPAVFAARKARRKSRSNVPRALRPCSVCSANSARDTKTATADTHGSSSSAAAGRQCRNGGDRIG